MSNLYREPDIDASYQVSIHLAKRFQKRRFLINSCAKSAWYARRQHSYNICKDFLSHNSWMKNLNFINSCTINTNWNIYTIFIQLKTTFFEKSVIKIAHFVPIRSLTWPPQAILVSDWLISKKSSLKPLGQMNWNLVGSILGRSSIKIAHFVPIH
jgi:hypothetical protein